MRFFRSGWNLRGGAVCLVLGAVSVGTASASWPIVIKGLSRGAVIDAWVEGEQAILKMEDGRLFSVDLSTPGIEQFLDRGALSKSQEILPQILTVGDIIAWLRAGISEEMIQANIAAARAKGIRYIISRKSRAGLEQAGATEDFLHFLAEVQRSGPLTTFITWSTPSSAFRGRNPPRENPTVTGATFTSGGTSYNPVRSTSYYGASYYSTSYYGSSYYPYVYTRYGSVFLPSSRFRGRTVPRASLVHRSSSSSSSLHSSRSYSAPLVRPYYSNYYSRYPSSYSGTPRTQWTQPRRAFTPARSLMPSSSPRTTGRGGWRGGMAGSRRSLVRR